MTKWQQATAAPGRSGQPRGGWALTPAAARRRQRLAYLIRRTADHLDDLNVWLYRLAQRVER